MHMSDITKNSKRIAQVEFMEEASAACFSPKRTKLASQEADLVEMIKSPSAAADGQPGNENSVSVDALTRNTSSFDLLVSYDADSDSSVGTEKEDGLRVIYADLQTGNTEAEVPTVNANDNGLRPASPITENSGESVVTVMLPLRPRRVRVPTRRQIQVVAVEKIPPPMGEVEEFFSVPERNMQEEFKAKYNYDVVKDVALEGRYQWIPIKP